MTHGHQIVFTNTWTQSIFRSYSHFKSLNSHRNEDRCVLRKARAPLALPTHGAGTLGDGFSLASVLNFTHVVLKNI